MTEVLYNIIWDYVRAHEAKYRGIAEAHVTAEIYNDLRREISANEIDWPKPETTADTREIFSAIDTAWKMRNAGEAWRGSAK